jgi:hypothetical protein
MATKSFTLKNIVHGITETFIVSCDTVKVVSNATFDHLPSVGYLSIAHARELWKEMTQNGWVRI